MIVEIVLELRDTDFYDGRLEWSLPVLPRVGEVFRPELLVRAFDVKKVYDHLSPADQDIWDGYKPSYEGTNFTQEELERSCFVRYLMDCGWLVLEEVQWGYSNKLGSYPLLTIRERENLYEPSYMKD